jgi:hypothetical protein
MRKYVIISADEVNEVDFNKVIEQSANDLRYSSDSSKTIVKYEGTQPSFLSGKTEYTWVEIMTILATDEWTPDEPE